jgi:AbrB family looped-hinge helix DNA binding protein
LSYLKGRIMSVTRATHKSAGRATAAEPLARKSEDSAYDLTIEQLAAEAGMSVRKIRDHHSRGLLPPPEARARVNYYNADHLARLRLISDLQADGFNLAAIERLMGSRGKLAGELGLPAAVTTPFDTAETPEVLTGRMGAKGQVVIPKPLRDRVHLQPGDEVDFALRDEGIVLVARRVPVRLGGRFRNTGMAARLLEDRAHEPR